VKAADSSATTEAPPVDITTMRASVALVLPPDVTPTDGDTLELLTGLLCGHMELLIPEIEQAAAGLPADDVPRYVALACVGEARGKLSARPGLLLSDIGVHQLILDTPVWWGICRLYNGGRFKHHAPFVERRRDGLCLRTGDFLKSQGWPID